MHTPHTHTHTHTGSTGGNTNIIPYLYYGGGFLGVLVIASFCYCCVKCIKHGSCDDCDCDCDCSCYDYCRSNLHSGRSRHRTSWSLSNRGSGSTSHVTTTAPRIRVSATNHVTTRTGHVTSAVDTDETSNMTNGEWTSSAPPSYSAALNSSVYKRPELTPPPQTTPTTGGDTNAIAYSEPPSALEGAPPPYPSSATELAAYPQC